MARVLSIVAGLCIVLGIGACTAATPLPPTAQPKNSATPAHTSSESALPTVPAGFQIRVVYDQLVLPTSIGTDGKHFYVGELKSGRVWELEDTNGDQVLDKATVFADGLNAPRGFAFRAATGELYVASRGRIDAMRDANGDGVAEQKRLIVDGLADYDLSHSNNGIAFGPDGNLYIADGAPRLKDMEQQGDTFLYQGKPLSSYAGTILSSDPDGKNLRVFARGFRNPFDLAFDRDGKLFATDNGEDDLPLAFQGDELNLIEQGADYGYPKISGAPPPGSTTRAPLINFPAHTSPDGLVVYHGTKFPHELQNQIFIALFEVGRKIVRAFPDASGAWQYQDFVTNLDRPVDLVQGADGALYVLDMNTGERRRAANPDKPAVIYRVDYAPTAP